MISVSDKTMCCGCATCKIVCPTNAIDMVTDEAGFVFPCVSEKNCVNCGRCEAVCPVLHHQNAMDLQHKVYVSYAKNDEIRYQGSSGGMFGTLARHVLDQNGVVYGAAFDDKLQLKCTEAKTVNELSPLFKSKYLQSDLGDTFIKIKGQLDAGTLVLFVATPCQVYALRLFLGRDYDNLITVDFVCHGVPSQSLFNKCKSYVEDRDHVEILDYTFRAKKKRGVTPHYYSMTYKKSGKVRNKTALYIDSPFYLGFQKYITLRDSCYDCHFSHSNRVSDITIGDFHDVDKYLKGINRFLGVSSLVVNTEKGACLWEAVRGQTISYELDFATLIQNKEMMCESTKKPGQRDAFVKSLSTENFDKVAEKYLNSKAEWSKKIYYSMPKTLRNILKKVLVR